MKKPVRRLGRPYDYRGQRLAPLLVKVPTRAVVYTEYDEIEVGREFVVKLTLKVKVAGWATRDDIAKISRRDKSRTGG
jgi:hypothetical protein